MKKNIKLVAATVIAMGLIASPVASAKEIVIKFSHVTTEATPKGKGAMLLKI